MSADIPTPRTDAQMESPNETTVPIEFARTLERELAAARKQSNDEFDAIITRNMTLERDNTALRAALEAIANRVPVMGSKDDYRAGQMHALEACAHQARAALAGGKEATT